MALREDAKFQRATLALPRDIFEGVLRRHAPLLKTGAWTYCGYAELPVPPDCRNPSQDIPLAVDNAFRLGPICGFERLPVIVTAGLRSSRFAPVLFWEVLHALAPDGVWIDVDDAERCTGTPLIAEDFPVREYFRTCLRPESSARHGRWLEQTFRKIAPAPIAVRIAERGWSFGILTSGPSPRAAQMAKAILTLDLPEVEVIFCGPRPAEAPVDPRVRTIDLEQPEPRGWITRKKNLLADAARYENLCLLHDRFVVTPEWAAALEDYGPSFSVLTFPQIHYADVDRRFGQRYADYQVLHQAGGITRARESHVYAGEHVFYAPYDDFSETAFCCGGLYVAKRTLWRSVAQNEALFHCEWEDVSFGLDCQRRGIPHRVNPLLTAESLTPHPLALTRIHSMALPDSPRRGHLHVVAEQAIAAQTTPARFRPIMARSRDSYYGGVLARFNAMPNLTDTDRVAAKDVRHCRGLADFWRHIEDRVMHLPLRRQTDLAEIGFFLSDTIYNWPNCELLSAVRTNARARAQVHGLETFDQVVGWGTGALYRQARDTVGRTLACLIDSDPSKWDSVVDDVRVKPPVALRDFDPDRTAVVVFSCFVLDIAPAVRRLGAFRLLAAADLLAGRRFAPLGDLIAYFDEVERYYPVLFTDSAAGVAS